MTQPAKCFGKRPTLFAQSGVELVGTAGNDVIAGSIGDDIIRAGGGNDRICGYAGDDTIDGGAGNDRIDGGPGHDAITGGGGKDRLVGAAGDDTLDGGKSKDVCIGGKGTDWLPSCNEAKQTRGTVTVNRNTKLKGPHKGTLVIGRNGVTLDCDGHTVTGAGRRVETVGVFVNRRKGVTVRNCEVRDHYWAILLLDSRRNTVVGNRAVRVEMGYPVTRSHQNKLIRNYLRDSTHWFGYGVFEGSSSNRFVDNVAVDCDNSFVVGDGRKNRFTGNVARDGRNVGFTVSPPATGGSGNRGNVFKDNSALENGGHGFADYTDGFRGDAGTDNRYEGNACRGNQWPSHPETLCD